MVGLGLLWVVVGLALLRMGLRVTLLRILRRVALLRRVPVLLRLVGCSPGGALVPTLLRRRPRIAQGPSLSGHERDGRPTLRPTGRSSSSTQIGATFS